LLPQARIARLFGGGVGAGTGRGGPDGPAADAGSAPAQQMTAASPAMAV
jgi:hypothetical protein